MKNISILLILVSLHFTNILNSQITVSFSDDNSSAGSTVDVDVTLDDFDQIVLMQYAINWDSSQFHFNSVLNVTTTLPQFTEPGNIGTPPSAASIDEGEISVSWSKTNTEPESLPDGHLLFTIRLDAIGDPCDVSSIGLSNTPTVIEVIDADFNSIGADSNDGEITINGTDCGGGNNSGLGIIGSHETVSSGTAVCVEVTVDSFMNIQSAQFGVAWNEDVVSYTGVENCVLPDFLLNESNVANGSLDFLWFDNTGVTPVTLNDGDVLMELCFTAVGAGGTSTDVEFVPLQSAPIDFGNDQGMTVPYYTVDGSVTISGSGGGNDFTLIAGGGEAEQGTETCFPVSVLNFVNIQSMQFAMMWDDNDLDYTGVQNLNLAQLSLSNFNQSAANKLRISWNDFGNGVTVPDNTIIFEICFEGVGACDNISDLMFTNDPPVNIEISNSNNEVLPFELINSEIEIVCNCGVELFNLNEPTCNGDTDGSINVTINGGTGNYTVTWKKGADVIQGPGSTQDLFGIGAGTYTIEVTDGGACNTSEIYVVNEPDVLNISETIVDASCDVSENGSIDIVISGGTGPYSCNWSGGAGTNCNIKDLNPGNYTVTVTDDHDCTAMATFSVEATNDLDVNGIVTDEVNGGDGAINTNVIAGIAPFMYLWNDGNTNPDRINLVKGEYCVTVTDNVGCTTEECFTIEPKPMAVDSEDIIDANCFESTDGSICLNVSGGCPDNDGNYNFVWSGPGGPFSNSNCIENLGAGSYSVTITDTSVPPNEIILTYPVGQPDQIIVSGLITASDETNNGTVDANVTGNSGSVTFEWENGDETEDRVDLEGGMTYSVTVTDSSNGCTSEESFYVPWSVINILPDLVDVSCFELCDGVIDGSIEYGNLPVTLTLNGEEVEFPVSDVCPGNYTLVAMDANGLTTSETVEILEPELLEISVDTVFCSNGDDGSITVFAQGGTKDYDFDWGFDNGATIFGLDPGEFTVVVTDANGCEAMMNDIEVEECDKGDCFTGSAVLTPNEDGFNEFFKIACIQNVDGDLSIYDRWGKEVYSMEDYDNSWTGLNNDGNELIEGGYMWVLKVVSLEGTNYYKGSLTLLRATN